MSGPAAQPGDRSANNYPKDEDGNCIYPEMKTNPLSLIEPQLKIELKALINEVLDERKEYVHPWYSYWDGVSGE